MPVCTRCSLGWPFWSTTTKPLPEVESFVANAEVLPLPVQLPDRRLPPIPAAVPERQLPPLPVWVPERRLPPLAGRLTPVCPGGFKGLHQDGMLAIGIEQTFLGLYYCIPGRRQFELVGCAVFKFGLGHQEVVPSLF